MTSTSTNRAIEATKSAEDTQKQVPGSDDSQKVESEEQEDGYGEEQTSTSSSSKKKKKKQSSNAAGGLPSDPTVPVSRLDPLLAIPPGIKSHVFSQTKGRGLVATRDFAEGETIFVEDSYINAPPSSAIPDCLDGKICSHCFLPTASSRLAVDCKKGGCTSSFCNRSCQTKAMTSHHGVMCQGNNPSIKPFLQFIHQHNWLSLFSVSRQLAMVLQSHSTNPPASRSIQPEAPGAIISATTEGPPTTLEETLTHLNSYATVSELHRRARNPGWEVERETFNRSMRQAYELLKKGLDPSNEERKNQRGWIVKDDFPEAVAKDLFSWDAFVSMLGRSNINMESHGSMFLVHSQLNHSCEANCSVRHLPGRGGVRPATRVTVLANHRIKAGEELTISYQDPGTSLARRRLLLWREYLFGPCDCRRCVEEVKTLSENEKEELEETWKQDEEAEKEVRMREEHAQSIESKIQKGEQMKKEDRNLGGLEDELRQSLGF